MLYIQVTAGRGPAECQRVVAKVVERLMQEAAKQGLLVEVIDREPGELNRTLMSALLSISGPQEEVFLEQWQGTVLWIAQSPYRRYHKRKNWFVGVQRINMSEAITLKESEIEFQTLRASGPGRQHVNKTESAVRAFHRPSAISVTASDQRSQHQNKQLAIERLKVKLLAWQTQQAMEKAQEDWQNHNTLQRGNPVRTFNEPLNS